MVYDNVINKGGDVLVVIFVTLKLKRTKELKTEYV